MDIAFKTMLGLAEKWQREGHGLEVVAIMHLELLKYGCEKGFLKDTDELVGEESDESIALRALAGAEIIRKFLGEDVGLVVNMNRDQHLALIKKADPVVDEVKPVLEAELGIPTTNHPEKKPTLH